LAGLAIGALLAVVIPAEFAASAPVIVASDSFARTVANGWGTTSVGGAWTVTADKSTKTTVASGSASISGLARARAVTATLKGVKASDIDLQATLSVASNSPLFYEALEGRRQSDGSAYRGRLNVAAGGRTDLSVSRVNGKTETALGRMTLPYTLAKGSRVRTELKITGTNPVTLSARSWVIGKALPAWQIQTTDSSAQRVSAAGAVGLWEYASGQTPSPVATGVDDFVATRDPDSGTPAPTPTPTVPTPPAGVEPARGSIAVGSATYAVPAGALIVSPSGSDSAAGTLAAPLATLGAAVSRATAGSTVVLRAGVYNQSVVIPASKTGITIQAYPREAVWFDGSRPITSWSRTGSTWTTTGWSTFFDNTLDGIADNPLFVGAANPLAARADQVFVNGAQLTQVATSSAVVAGTFAVNQSAKTITIGTDPQGKEVRASNLTQAIYSTAEKTTLQGFGVRRYATPYNVHGAVRLGAQGSTARNLVLQDDATTGIQVAGDAMTLDHLTVTNNGMQGVAANRSYGFSLTNSILSGNNSQQFNSVPVSGGLKITRSRGVTVSNNDVTDNKSFGLWFDESCYDVTVTGNTVTGNGLHGIELEISQHAIVADNVVTGNAKSGIRLLDTGDTQIVNNDIGSNGVFGIQLSQDARREADASVPGHDPRRPFPDPSFSWLTQDVTIANNSFGSGGQFQIYALDNHTGIPVDKWRLTITGNLFNLHLTSQQALIMAWGLSDNVAFTRFNDVASLAAAKGPSWKNSETVAVLPLSGMRSAVASAAPTALALPADVAAAIGQPVGVRHVGAF
jgi:parallel beta-helix repeat protein